MVLRFPIRLYVASTTAKYSDHMVGLLNVNISTYRVPLSEHSTILCRYPGNLYPGSKSLHGANGIEEIKHQAASLPYNKKTGNSCISG